MLNLKTGDKRVKVNVGKVVVEAGHALANLHLDELADHGVAAHHGKQVGLGRLVGHAVGDKIHNARDRLIGGVFVDTAGSTLRLVERYGIKAAQTHAGTVGQHALGGILKQVVVLNARDDLVVAHALQAQRGDDTHLGQQKLLARKHASQRYFVGVIHRTHSKGSGLFICIGAMQTCFQSYRLSTGS